MVSSITLNLKIMIRTSFLLFFVCTPFLSYTQNHSGASLNFEEDKFDFGNVKINTKVSHIFYFTNTSKKPLRLKKVTASCGCTTPLWDSTLIAPGSQGSITVVFECFPLEKIFSKTITVESSAESTLYYIDIRGKCVDIYKATKEKFSQPLGKLNFESTHSNFDFLYNNSSLVQKQLQYFNASDDTIVVYEFNTPSYIQCASSPNIILPHQLGSVIINYNASMNPDFGFKLDKIVMRTNDLEMPDKLLYASADILEYFDSTIQNRGHILLREQDYDFGKLKVGDIKTHVFDIKNIGLDTLFIRRVRASCGCTESVLSLDKIAPGKSASLKVIYNTAGAVRGDNHKLITIISSDRKQPVIIIGVHVSVD